MIWKFLDLDLKLGLGNWQYMKTNVFEVVDFKFDRNRLSWTPLAGLDAHAHTTLRMSRQFGTLMNVHEIGTTYLGGGDQPLTVMDASRGTVKRPSVFTLKNQYQI